MNKINIELKKAILNWICENINEMQIHNECTKHFRNYMYDNNGNFLIGGEDVAKFCHNAIDLITEKESF